MGKKALIKFGLAVFFITSLTGCASKMQYHSEPLTIKDQNYKLDLKMKKEINPGFFITDVKNVVTLYINDEIALQGSLNRDESGELQGMYNNQKLNLECDKDSIFSQTKCIVHLDKKRLGEFTLAIGR